MNYKIFADTGFDFTKEMLEEYNINLLPIMLIDENKEYRDFYDIESKTVYENMRKGVVYKTAQVPYQLYYNNFKSAIDEKKDIICFTLSSGISGSYQSALSVRNNILEDYPDVKINIIDLKSASIGGTLSIIRLIKMINDGVDLKEVLKAADFYAENMLHIFSVSDMQYLYRGGRMTKTQKVVTGILNIKLILEVKREDGTLGIKGKVRGEKALFKKVIDFMELSSKDGKFNTNQTIGICHAESLKSVKMLKEMIKEKFGNINIIVTDMSSTIGCHTGPGAFAVVFLKDIYKNYNII